MQGNVQSAGSDGKPKESAASIQSLARWGKAISITDEESVR
jgi:hypothetical protein